MTQKCVYKVRAIHYFESDGASKKLHFRYSSVSDTRLGAVHGSVEKQTAALARYLRDSSYRALRWLSGKPLEEDGKCRKTRG